VLASTYPDPSPVRRQRSRLGEPHLSNPDHLGRSGREPERQAVDLGHRPISAGERHRDDSVAGPRIERHRIRARPLHTLRGPPDRSPAPGGGSPDPTTTRNRRFGGRIGSRDDAAAREEPQRAAQRLGTAQHDRPLAVALLVGPADQAGVVGAVEALDLADRGNGGGERPATDRWRGVQGDSPGLLFGALVLTYTGLGCFTLFMATIPAETVPRAVMATALGLIMGVGEVVGGFVAPALAGQLSDVFGLDAAMFVSAGAAVIVVLLSLALTETAPARTGR
jgi:hypothetical protein